MDVKSCEEKVLQEYRYSSSDSSLGPFHVTLNRTVLILALIFKQLICRIKSEQSPNKNPQKKSFKVILQKRLKGGDIN